MKAQATHTYTVRGIPAEVDAALRQKAARKKVSLNQVIVEELSNATVPKRKFADFSDLVGTWEDDPAFDEIIASQRKIDWAKWK